MRPVAKNTFSRSRLGDAGLASTKTGQGDRIFPVRDDSGQEEREILFTDMIRSGHGSHSFLSEKEWDPLPLMDGS